MSHASVITFFLLYIFLTENRLLQNIGDLENVLDSTESNTPGTSASGETSFPQPSQPLAAEDLDDDISVAESETDLETTEEEPDYIPGSDSEWEEEESTAKSKKYSSKSIVCIFFCSFLNHAYILLHHHFQLYTSLHIPFIVIYL